MHYFIEELYSNILINTNNYKIKLFFTHSCKALLPAASRQTYIDLVSVFLLLVTLSLLTVARLRLSTLLIGTATG